MVVVAAAAIVAVPYSHPFTLVASTMFGFVVFNDRALFV